MPAPRRVIAGATLALALASCRQILGIGDPGPPLVCEPPAFAEPFCDTCLRGACCAEIAACQGEPRCEALLACLAACADDACRGACESAQKLGESSAALLACLSARCDEPCGLVCGGAGAPITGCLPCGASCCAEGAKARADLDYQRLRACRDACAEGDGACAERCRNEHAGGADLEDHARVCVAEACKIDADWSCVGWVPPRAGSAKQITLTLTVKEPEKLAAIAGVQVKACAIGDLACTSPIAVAPPTDFAGRASLTVPLSPLNGSDAYAGAIELTHPSYVDELVYLVPPAYADTQILAYMPSVAQLAEVAASGAVTLSPQRGHLLVGMVDCWGWGAAGVSFTADTADAASGAFYLVPASSGDQVFNFGAHQTTKLGYGALLNLPEGPVQLGAHVPDLCLDAATVSLGVRRNAVSFALLRPTR
jgi:hypothetical protein